MSKARKKIRAKSQAADTPAIAAASVARRAAPDPIVKAKPKRAKNGARAPGESEKVESAPPSAEAAKKASAGGPGQDR